MTGQHSRATIASMTVIAEPIAVLLHEGVGHGVTAYLRGTIPTELTSNHLSSVYVDKWVQAGGTLVNLAVGALALVLSRAAGPRANTRYFLWLLAALNLLPGAGYFLFSGVLGVGDWAGVIAGWPHPIAWRAGMALFGAALYALVMWRLARAVAPFGTRAGYNVLGRLPYLVAGALSCAAGTFDPLAGELFLVSTVAAAFGGSSGLLWLDNFLPRGAEPTLVVRRAPVWWIAAAIVGAAYVAIVGPGIRL